MNIFKILVNQRMWQKWLASVLPHQLIKTPAQTSRKKWETFKEVKMLQGKSDLSPVCLFRSWLQHSGRELHAAARLLRRRLYKVIPICGSWLSFWPLAIIFSPVCAGQKYTGTPASGGGIPRGPISCFPIDRMCKLVAF